MNYLTSHEGGGGIDFQASSPRVRSASPAEDPAEDSAPLAKTEFPKAIPNAQPELSLGEYLHAQPLHSLAHTSQQSSLTLAHP